MFERFTAGSRQVVVLAHKEAERLSCDRIGTEHLLLGVIGEGQGLGARALASLGVSLEEARSAVAPSAPPTGTTSGQMPFTPQAKWVLERALRDSLALGHEHVDTEHILLGLTEEPDGAASRILAGFGTDPDAVRAQVFALFTGPDTVTRPTIPPELSEELREVRLAKEAAQAAGDRERAEELAGRQAQLIEAAHAIWEPDPGAADEGGLDLTVGMVPLQPIAAEEAPGEVARRPRRAFEPVAVGAALGAVTLGLGVVIGWAIWG